MPAVQRQGDSNSAGGVATGGIASVRVNGRPVVVNGIGVTPHAPWGQPHLSASTSGGNATVRANGKPINTAGNPDTCGHPRSGGSPDVRIG